MVVVPTIRTTTNVGQLGAFDFVRTQVSMTDIQSAPVALDGAVVDHELADAGIDRVSSFDR